MGAKCNIGEQIVYLHTCINNSLPQQPKICLCEYSYTAALLSGTSWSSILGTFYIPNGEIEAFIHECIEQNAVICLAMYSVFAARNSDMNNLVNLNAQLASWISALPYRQFDDFKLLLLIKQRFEILIKLATLDINQSHIYVKLSVLSNFLDTKHNKVH